MVDFQRMRSGRGLRKIKFDLPFAVVSSDRRVSFAVKSKQNFFARIGSTDYEIQVQPLDLEEYYEETEDSL